MHWSRITNKQTLIYEIKEGVKRIRLEVVRHSVSSWTNRLYRMVQRNGDYIF